LATAPSAFSAAFSVGDVFASIGGGIVEVRSQNGTFVATLNTTLGGYTTGSTFDQAGNFYVTGFSSNVVSKFDSTGTLVNSNWAGGIAFNESIVFNAAGDAYIGNAGSNSVRKVNSSGTTLFDYTGMGSNTDWIDLASDQTTLFYSDESGTIRRWDLVSNTPLSNFAVAGDSFYAKRVRPNGDLMAAAGSGNVYRYNSAGVLQQTYAIGIGSVFALNLDPDGTSFWTGSTGGTTVRQVRISDGSILQSWDTSGGQLFGLAVLGEVQAGGGGVGGGTPEPGTLALLLGGLGAFAFARRRRNS